MKHDWEYKKLRDVCQKGSSNIQQNKIVGVVGEYPVYGASGYVQNVDFYHQECPYIGIVKDGSGVGRVNRYPAKSSLLGTMQYILPSSAISLGYLMYCLQALKLSGFASGAAIPHIYFRDYGECLIPVPPLSIQQQIVAELDKVSEIIEKKKQQVKELDSLAQSMFYDMFGDPVENEKGWEVKKFQQLFKLKSGDNLVAKNFEDGQYPVYGGNGIAGYHNQYNRVGRYVIIGRVGVYCGNVRIVNGYFWLTDNAFETMYSKDMFDEVFLKYLLNTIDLHQYSNQAAQPVISNTGLKDIAILLPPLPFQQAFAEKIEAIEKQKELIAASIKDAQTLFDSRMDYWFGE